MFVVILIMSLVVAFSSTSRAFTNLWTRGHINNSRRRVVGPTFQRAGFQSNLKVNPDISGTISVTVASNGPEFANSSRGRKEKRARTKTEQVPDDNTGRPPRVPLKFANVKSADISQLAELDFDTVIDVRTPAEFELDHIPGAINYPVLDNEERIIIGTLHNGNVFEARRRGAALISRHIAHLLENEFEHKPKNWRPLIYCWRGGLRSGSMALILAQVGWQVHQLNGGYKSYRSNLMELLPALCQKCILKIVSAPTGSGKTHFLAALQRAGKQVIDLEDLASHRGSVLGNIPGENQPSQRLFDTRLLLALQKLDISKPIYIESESRKIGNVALPAALSDRMHESECLYLDVPQAERVKGLCEDYRYYVENPEILITHLAYLSNVRTKPQLDEWSSLARSGQFPELVKQLLEIHYDPLYWKSLRRNYPQIDDREVSQQLIVNSISPSSLDEAVTRIIEKEYVYAPVDLSLRAAIVYDEDNEKEIENDF